MTDIDKMIEDACQAYGDGMFLGKERFKAALLSITPNLSDLASLKSGQSVVVTAKAGICAWDKDECTVTLALDNEDEVRRLIAALPSKNRVLVIDEEDWPASRPEAGGTGNG